MDFLRVRSCAMQEQGVCHARRGAVSGGFRGSAGEAVGFPSRDGRESIPAHFHARSRTP
jgi:hypothetical protein